MKVYCIESPHGKHHFIPNDLKDEGHICEFCFLPPEKCNYKELRQL